MAPPKDWPAVLFVHLAAVACCVAAGWLVTVDGSPRVPTKDEFAVLSDYARRGEVGGWLVVHHNEHRYPLGKLVWLATLRATGYNFRAPTYLTVALHTSAAVLLLWAIRGHRGRSHAADAVVPGLLLHWGHAHNLIYGYQLVFALCVYGVAGWVWAAGRLARGGGTGWLVAASGYGTVLVLSGGFGIIFTPLLVAWIGYTAWHRRSAPDRRVGRVVAGAFAAAWVGYSAWAWATTPTLVVATPDRSPWAFLQNTTQYLAVGFGERLAVPHHPEWVAPASWVAAGGLYAAAVGVLLVRWWRGAFRGPLAAAVLLALGGVILLGAASAYARGYGLAARFVTPSAIGLAVVWVGLGAAGRVRAWVRVAVLLLATGVWWVNMETGRREGYYTRIVLAELANDLDAGLPPVFVQGRYATATPVFMFDGTADMVRALRDTRIGPFAHSGPDPEFTLVSVTGVVLPLDLSCGPDAVTAGNPPRIPLPDPSRPIVGVRVTVRADAAGGWQRVLLRWRDADTGVERREWAFPPWVPARTALAFPVSGRPADLRIEAGTGLQRLTVEAVEWMAAPAR
jgi:hypothetical protein